MRSDRGDRASPASSGKPPTQAHSTPGGDAPNRGGAIFDLHRDTVGTVIVLVALQAALLAAPVRDYSEFHVILDTGAFLLSALLAVMLRDIGRRLGRAFPIWLAGAFAVTSVLEFIHTLVGAGSFGGLEPTAQFSNLLRPTTWSPAAHVLPIGIGAAIWLLRRGEKPTRLFLPALVLLSAALFEVLLFVPPYTAPAMFDVTRPWLVLVPLLWLAVGLAAWHSRDLERKMRPLAGMAVFLAFGHAEMLYSQAPHDTPAMAAHLAKVCGYVIFLLALMRMASGDMLERLRAERALAELNAELEARVRDRTAQLAAANRNLESEMAERQRAADALRDSQERLRNTVDNISDAFIILDTDWRFIFANREALRLLDRDEAKLIGTIIWEEIEGSAGSVFDRQYRNAVSKQESTSFVEYFAPMGKWFRVNAYPSTEGLAIYFQDVTKDKMQQEQLRLLEGTVQDRTAELEATNKTLESEIVVRRAAEQRAEAQVGRLNLLHQITRAIGARQDLASIYQVAIRSVEEELPADFCCLCLYDPVDSVLTVAGIGVKNAALAAGLGMSERAKIDVDANGLARCLRGTLVYEPDLARLDFPFPLRMAQGGLGSAVFAPLQLETSVFGILIAGRTVPNEFSSGECEFLHQLSEHVALAAHQAEINGALQQAYDDLRQSQQAVMQQERMRALGQMASGIAHDINNALTPASLYTESLLEDMALDEKQRGTLEIVRRAIEDVGHTVSRMREFYREPEKDVKLSPVMLNDMVRQVVDLTRARWSDMSVQRGIAIEVKLDLAGDLPAVMGVESEIREALINLVLNAVDALPEGGRIELHTDSVPASPMYTAPQVRVEITDNGVGMDEATRKRCLEPFFTTKGERGTGLGLGMVHGVMQRHGGDLEIDTAPGRGTTMRLVFSAADLSQSAAPRPAPVQPLPRRLRLLIVDDDPVLLKSLRDILEVDGHVVDIANGGQAGIDAFTAGARAGTIFTAVITDLGMPRVDGRQVAAAIKAEAPSTPVILLTGWGQRLIAEDDIPPHVDKVLSKPPKLRDLRQALLELCPIAP